MPRSLHRRPRWRAAGSVALITSALFAACAAGISASLAEQKPQSPAAPLSAVEIAFLDVGQGDAALITAPDGRRVLVDGGPRGSGIAAYLRNRRIDTLELVVASHNHADHIGGLEEVFAAFRVRHYMENGVPSATATYARLVDAVARSGAVVLKAEQRSIGLGELRLHVLPSPPGAVSHNARSIGLVVQLGDFSALFTGDAEEETLAWWLAQPAVQQMSAVKVSHHGARNGTTMEFVRTTSPAVAVISVGARNQYQHPSPATLSMWGEAARHVLRTDRDGTVTVIGAPDGNMLLSTTRGAHPLKDLPISPHSPVSLEGSQ